jgi:hypothetical protein
LASFILDEKELKQINDCCCDDSCLIVRSQDDILNDVLISVPVSYSGLSHYAVDVDLTRYYVFEPSEKINSFVR